MSLSKQMRHRDAEMVPRFLVRGMFGLMLASLGMVAYAQWFDVPNRGVLVEAPIVQTREVYLSGTRNSEYKVSDADGIQLATSASPRAGFIAVLGRAIDHERQSRKLPLGDPIRVVRRDNGNIAVIDPTTGIVFELIGYGKDNVAAFAGLLD